MKEKINLEKIKKRETLFTKIINKQIPANIIYEDENTIAILDIFPFEKGHALVIPKIPFKTIFEMPEKNYLELQKVILKISNHLKEKLNCDLNIIQNNGKIAGQEIEHVHFHLIPRKETKQIYCSKNSTKYLKEEDKNYLKKLKLN